MPCWSLFRAQRTPRFCGLSDGFRALRGWILHPDTRALVRETGSVARALVNFATQTPDGAHDAAHADDATDAAADASQGEGADADEELSGRGWAEFRDAGDTFYHHAASNRTQWALPRRVAAPARGTDAANTPASTVSPVSDSHDRAWV